MLKHVKRQFISRLIEMSAHADDRTWFIIPCPSNVRLTKVDKERGTHGSVYVLWDIDEKSPVWVGQSIPALVRSVNEKAVINIEKRLHASSLYRVLRGEARKRHHKSWRVSKYNRDALVELNLFLGDFCSVVYCSKSPELWRCKTVEELNEIDNVHMEAAEITNDEKSVPDETESNTRPLTPPMITRDFLPLIRKYPTSVLDKCHENVSTFIEE